jgi:hypothetical protein
MSEEEYIETDYGLIYESSKKITIGEFTVSLLVSNKVKELDLWYRV